MQRLPSLTGHSVKVRRLFSGEPSKSPEPWRTSSCRERSGDKTLEASKSEALIAVDSYNRPRQCRSVEAFFIHMHLAWQLLLHARLRREGVDYRYREPGSRRFVRANGEPKTWELARCVAHRWPDANDPVRRNLELTVALRNKIEHRYIEGVDVASAGYAQASLLNYEHELTSTFGDTHNLADSLRVPLFIGTFTTQGAERLRKAKRSLPMDVRHLIATAEEGVDADVLEDLRYEFRIHLVPKIGPKTEADLSLTFVPEEGLTEEERTVLTTLGRAGTVILRERQRGVANYGLMRPKDAVAAIQQQIPYRFTMGTFVRAWKTLKVRPAPGSAHPERTDERYCLYDAANRVYVYTEAFVRKLARDLATPKGFRELFGQEPQLTGTLSDHIEELCA